MDRGVLGLVVLASLVGCDDASPHDDGKGTVFASWGLYYDVTSGEGPECSEVGAVEVEAILDAQFGDEHRDRVETFPCDDPGGYFLEVVEGDYYWGGILRDADGDVLSEVTVEAFRRIILEEDGDENMNLRFPLPEPDEEDCNADGDEDGDGDAGCDDSDCADQPECDDTCAGGGALVLATLYNTGGAGGAAFNQDFVVLKNRGDGDVDLDGWSLQVRTSALATWSKADLPAATVPAGGFYLIALGMVGSQGAALPTPDHSDSLFLADGRDLIVALMENSDLLTACPTTSLSDLVGIGDAPPCVEGAPVVPDRIQPSPTEAFERDDGGCVDTDDNSDDIAIVNASTPPSSATPSVACTCP